MNKLVEIEFKWEENQMKPKAVLSPLKSLRRYPHFGH